MKKIRLLRADTHGFTMIEILVVLAITTTIVGILTVLIIQFNRQYVKGEESTIFLQEAGMFLASLRSDLINAVIDKNLPAKRWSEGVKAESDRLSFLLYRDAEGNIEKVEYIKEGGSLKRLHGKKSFKLVSNHLQSLSWVVQAKMLQGAASGARQLWIDLDFTLSGNDKPGIKAKPLQIRAKMFPTRLNRQLNIGF